MSKAKYNISLDFEIIYDVEEKENLKTSLELATDIITLVCDEVTTAGGVAVYKVTKHNRRIRGANNDRIRKEQN